ncbi:hypothetical protein POVCU2_0033570 [Plasmodium ovale curtisi]|uniref:Uncharacterized protein n=1 Tax=Plasmodium ovale curtisi TaxID=864141 RepID=A0A1A8XAE7_PLAOA|nr:hypothetical protein POVCU2_0033570 [Plasmodium ovale curtisi]SBT01233.1 hypothetical protein POVCU1_065370 [Plasmodium ovale curtisi]
MSRSSRANELANTWKNSPRNISANENTKQNIFILNNRYAQWMQKQVYRDDEEMRPSWSVKRETCIQNQFTFEPSLKIEKKKHILGKQPRGGQGKKQKAKWERGKLVTQYLLQSISSVGKTNSLSCWWFIKKEGNSNPFKMYMWGCKSSNAIKTMGSKGGEIKGWTGKN